jgi:hypothetical protein
VLSPTALKQKSREIKRDMAPNLTFLDFWA